VLFIDEICIGEYNSGSTNVFRVLGAKGGKGIATTIGLMLPMIL